MLFKNNKKNTNRTTYPKSPSLPIYITQPLNFNFLNLKKVLRVILRSSTSNYPWMFVNVWETKLIQFSFKNTSVVFIYLLIKYC